MERLIFVGDIHGELRKLVWTLVIKEKIKDANVVIAGDFGTGFIKKGGLDNLYRKVKKRLEENNITIYSIRGNHDDPEYFDGKHNYSRLIFLEDYSQVEISGKIILPIGGAISIDKDWRIKSNYGYEKIGSSKRVWWPGEDVTRIPLKNLPGRVDIIVTHEAPISFEPIVVRQDVNVSSEDWDSILETRKYLDDIARNVGFNYWIHGHYHKSTSGSFKDSLYRGLNIEELFEIY